MSINFKVAEKNSNTLDIYYSAIFPPYAAELKALESSDNALAATFISRYRTWLAVHSLLLHKDKEDSPPPTVNSPVSDEQIEVLEQQERVRLAVVATLMAKKEARLGVSASDAE